METRQPGKEIRASFGDQSAVTYLSGPLLPYLQLAIIITNNEGNAKEVAARIQPAEIDYYYPGFIEGTDQPQYTPLPVHVGTKEENIPMTACFERIATRKLWYTQVTFGHPFQPVRLSTQNPFNNVQQQA